MSPENLAVIHLTHADDESVCRTQQSIAREISSGRDVVVVCDGQRLMREERLMLARPAIARSQPHVDEASGRVAIVNSGCESTEKHLPSHVGAAVQFFASMDCAMKWLRPANESCISGTLCYFTLPAC